MGVSPRFTNRHRDVVVLLPIGELPDPRVFPVRLLYSTNQVRAEKPLLWSLYFLQFGKFGKRKDYVVKPSPGRFLRVVFLVFELIPDDCELARTMSLDCTSPNSEVKSSGLSFKVVTGDYCFVGRGFSLAACTLAAA